MNVEFNPGGAYFIPVQQASSRRTQAGTSGDDFFVSFPSQSLQNTLKLSSQVRPAKVAQANALLGGNYPSDEDLERLASFLASRL